MLYDRAPCGLLQTRANGTVVHVNETLCAWLLRTKADLIGCRFQDLLSVGSRIFHQTHWMPLLQMQGSVAEVQLEVMRQDGQVLPVLVNAAVYADGDTVMHDIALFITRDRRQYERELLHARRRAEELLESERKAQDTLQEVMRAREEETKQRADLAEQLIGIVSHDLRTPLQAVLLGSALLDEDGLSPPQARIVTRIQASGERANRLIDDLLDFTQARVGAGIRAIPRELDIQHLVADCVDELRLVWPGRVVEHVHRGSTIGVADGDRLTQAITNLVNNALTYGTADRPVTVTSAVDPRGVVLTVHNFGTPIPDSLRPHIFEPLRRGEDQVKLGSRSVGLGLYIVQQIARAHGGTVDVRSLIDEGTTFTLVLP
jgi:sigma-B regulation protein RsbU (phosphoserine phosphatase)